ncbi:hypothetical protein ACFL5V_07340, partial [Fibrobacterota bacterium]
NKLCKKAVNKKKIFSLYTAKPVEFGEKKRSEFFWLLKAKIKFSDVLVLFNRPHVPITKKIAELMDEMGMRYVSSKEAAAVDGIEIWRSGALYGKMKNELLKKLFFKVFVKKLSILDVFGVSIYMNFVYYLIQYAWWKDFFQENNICINFCVSVFPKESIPMNAAMADCGGINITYQYSNIEVDSVHYSTISDVIFLWGPEYRRYFQNNASMISYYVNTGFITDYCFKNVKEYAQRERNRLKKRGANFIICYFDENSSYSKMDLISNNRSFKIYKRLIEFCIDHKDIGLICCPKFPKTLEDRMPGITSKIEVAEKTGRFIIKSGNHHADDYPAASALSADLAIGLLIGGTTVLESVLAGTPTVFLDLEKLYFYKVYNRGRNKTVFDNIEELLRKVISIKKKPDKEFGNLSEWVRMKDSYHDGNASLRIGTYIRNIYNLLGKGLSRTEALENANSKYVKEWGKENLFDAAKLKSDEEQNSLHSNEDV